MTNILRAAATAAATAGVAVLFAAGSAGTALAACSAGKPRAEMTYEDAQAVYDCLEDELVAGYRQGEKRWVPAAYVESYRDWTPVSRLPADPGFHGGRYLLTYVNETGADEYLKYAEERGPMPEGTLIAKESFDVTEDGTAKPGPLFLMEKVAAGESPETNDWYYYMVSPQGDPVAVDVFEGCNSCHSNFAAKDYLGYPVPEARVEQ